MERLLARLRLAGLLAGQVALVFALHRLGGDPLAVAWDDLPGWLATTEPADAIVAAARLLGLVTGWWLLVSTAAYTLARLLRAAPSAARLVGGVTLPSVRRLVDRGLAASVAATVLASGPTAVLADDLVVPPGATSVSEVGTAEGEGLPGDLLVPPGALVEEPVVEGPVAPPPPAPSTSADAAGPAVVEQPHTATHPSSVHEVAPGEHLWAIAAAHVAEALGVGVEELDASKIAPYWREVVAANRDRLRSGDPDLVYPGETVELPALGGLP